MDRIAEASQTVDIAAQSPAGYFEPLGELRAGPVTLRLEQREEPQKPGRRLDHSFQCGTACGLILSATAATRNRQPVARVHQPRMKKLAIALLCPFACP